MTWNAKKHSELVRLLKEFIQEHSPSSTSEQKELWDNALLGIRRWHPEDARIRHADKMILFSLNIWLEVVGLRYKMKPYRAIFWLVEQYYDYAKKEKMMPAFRQTVGAGTVDSIARRIYQKAKERHELPSMKKMWSAPEWGSHFDTAVLEAGGDLYKLVFEELELYPEPSVYLDGGEDGYLRWLDRT